VGPGAERIPATIGARQNQVGVSVNVCIDGRGPFPFLVDTGASSSGIAAALAQKLALPVTGQPEAFQGAGCTTQVRNRVIRSWSVAGFTLQPQTLTAIKFPKFGRGPQPLGMIGSDVWSRFGQLRVDYRRAELVIPSREGPPPTGQKFTAGVSASALPRFLAARAPKIEVTMSVVTARRQALAVVGVAFGHSPPLPFLVDTGATTSAVQTSVATRVGLKRLGQADTQGTLCSIAIARRVLTGRWFITPPKPGSRLPARHALYPQVIDEANLGRGPAGYFGSDQMSRFGSVVFDYAGGRLFLGAG
jgi:predicted aspartyl protease